MMIIEAGTPYADFIGHLDILSFDVVCQYSKRCIDDLPKSLQDRLYDDLNREEALLTTELEMQMYLHAFGAMLKARLELAFKEFEPLVWKHESISIIDYGCGQGVATMVLTDYLRCRHVNLNKIKRVILIDVSEICLKRAALLISKFLPDAEIETLHKDINDIEEIDISTDSEQTIHLLSGIIDVDSIDIDLLAGKINHTRYLYNEILCVGPMPKDSIRKKRSIDFLLRLNVEFLSSMEYEESEWINNWSVQYGRFNNSSLKYLSIERAENLALHFAIDAFYNRLADPEHVFLCYDMAHLKTRSTSDSEEEKGIDDLIQEAEKGSVKAMAKLMAYYFSVAKVDSALRYTELAANRNDVFALWNMAVLYHFGLYDKAVDLKKAKVFYCQIIDQELANDNPYVLQYVNQSIFNLAKLLNEEADHNMDDIISLLRKSRKPNNAILNFMIVSDAIKDRLSTVINGKGECFVAFYWPSESASKTFNKIQSLSDRDWIFAYNLGICYEYGIECDRDKNKALQCYLKTIQKEDDGSYKSTKAFMRIAKIYFDRGDRKAAVYWWKEALHNDETCKCAAITNIAIAIEDKERQTAFKIWCDYSLPGKGCEKCNEAFNYDAIKRECPKAQYHIALYYRDGLMGEINYEEANKWALKAVTQGFPTAELYMASCYKMGKGYAKDEQLAEYWLTKAAIHNVKEAQYRLFFLKRHTNKKEAIRWIALAANNNHVDAQEILARLSTVGLLKNEEDANYWFTRAAVNDNIDCQIYLGKHSKDIEVAKEWLLRAAKLGSEEAQKEYDKIMEKDMPF